MDGKDELTLPKWAAEMLIQQARAKQMDEDIERRVTEVEASQRKLHEDMSAMKESMGELRSEFRTTRTWALLVMVLASAGGASIPELVRMIAQQP